MVRQLKVIVRPAPKNKPRRPLNTRTLDAVGRLAFRNMAPEAYYATLSVGPLIARVFTHSPLAEKGGQFANVNTPGFDQFLVPIWPYNFHPTWPPDLDFRDFLRLISTIPKATYLRGA